MSKTQILFIHGGGTFKSRKDFFNYISKVKVSLDSTAKWHGLYFDKKLGSKFEILRPTMPMKDDARYEEWKVYFEKLCNPDIKVEDIIKITKEDLYSCYDNFYQPNNMFILIVGNFSVETALDVIRERVENRENKYKVLPKIKKEKEPYAVAKKCEVVKFNIDVSKLTYSFKMKKKDFNIQDDYILDLYLAILLKILFGSCF